MNEIVHYNPLFSDFSSPAPWDKTACGLSPDFEDDVRTNVDGRSVQLTFLAQQFKMTNSQHKTTCVDCIAKMGK